MNYKLYAFLLTLSLAFSAALQAMKRALPIARSLSRPTSQTGWQALARAQFTNNNEHGYRQEEPRFARDANYLPAVALAIGTGLTTQHALEEQDSSFSIDKLDINSVKAIVEALKKCSTKQQEIIMTAIVQNIDKYPCYDLCKILEASNKQNQKIIATAIVQNIDEYNGFMLTRFLEAIHEESQNIITSAIAQNINKYDGRILCDILEASHAKNQGVITKAIVQNINKYDCRDLCDMLKASHAKNQEVITKAIAQNLDKYNNFVLTKLLEASHEQSQKIIIMAIANSINKNIDKYDGQDLAKILEATHAKNQEVITKAIVQNIDKLNELKLRKIIELSNEQNKEIIINMVIDSFIGQNTNNSQSAAHLKNNAKSTWEYITQIINNPLYKATFQQALRHERQVSDTCASFYHSQRSSIYWLELLYTKLWERKYNQKITNYLFTRFPDDTNEFANALLQLDGQEKKSIFLANKFQDDPLPYLLWANYALFGNSTLPTCCSAALFLNNINMSHPDITTQIIMNKFGDQKLFVQYKTEFEKLENEFKKIVPNSVLLQLNIPHQALNEHVYLTAINGSKQKLQISGKETDDVNTIIKTLKTNPKAIDDTDSQQFCIIMTPDTIHTLREQGAEVRVYGNFDQEKLNTLTCKLEALIARVAKENPQTFSAKLTPTQSYQAYKPVLNELLPKKD